MKLKVLSTLALVTVSSLAYGASFSQEDILKDHLGRFNLPGVTSSSTSVTFGQVASGHVDDLQKESLLVHVQVPASGDHHIMRLRDDQGVDVLSVGRVLLNVLDVDGDGYDDVLSCEPGFANSLRLFLYRGPTDANVESAVSINGVGSPVADCGGFGLSTSSFDVDNDGLKDILINYRDTISFDNKSMLLRNSGSQSFVALDLPLSEVFSLGDLDNNSLLDVLGTDRQSGDAALSHNIGGTSGFSQSISLSTLDFPLPGFISSGSIAPMADYNGNRMVDFVSFRDAGGFMSGCCSLYEYLGSGDFRETKLGGAANSSPSFSLADIDGDGKEDIISASESADSKLFRVLAANSSATGFSSTFQPYGDIDSRLNLGAMSEPVALDYDGDGDMDVVVNQSSSLSSLSSMVSDEKIYLLRQNRTPVFTGSPLTEVNAGSNFSFLPQLTDPDGDQVTFTLSNAPTWLSINTSTGALSGIAPESDVGRSYGGLVITASDQSGADNNTAQMGPFAISVRSAGTNPTPTPPNASEDKSSGGGGSLGFVLIGLALIAVRRSKAALQNVFTVLALLSLLSANALASTETEEGPKMTSESNAESTTIVKTDAVPKTVASGDEFITYDKKQVCGKPIFRFSPVEGKKQKPSRVIVKKSDKRLYIELEESVTQVQVQEVIRKTRFSKDLETLKTIAQSVTSVSSNKEKVLLGGKTLKCFEIPLEFNRSTLTLKWETSHEEVEHVILSGPKEQWYITADIPLKETKELSYNFEDQTVSEVEKPGKFYIGFNWKFTDLYSTNKPMSLLSAKIMLSPSSRPMKTMGVGLGLDVSNPYFDLELFAARVRTQADKVPVGERDHLYEHIWGASFDLSRALGWLGG